MIRWLVAELDLPIEVIGVPTVREADGLAMSSRNQYLSPGERQQAPALYQTLVHIRQRLRGNSVDHSDLEQEAILRLEKLGFAPDYVAIRHAETLAEAKNHTDPLVILSAARLGSTRLIDNLRV